MSNYLLDENGDILTDDSSTVLLTWFSSEATLTVAVGSFTFSGLAATLTERAAMVLRLRYRKF